MSDLDTLRTYREILSAKQFELARRLIASAKLGADPSADTAAKNASNFVALQAGIAAVDAALGALEAQP